MRYSSVLRRPLADHITKWRDCTACPLCEVRKDVVFYRGKIPAPLLFISKAPSPEANLFGEPYPRRTDPFYTFLPGPRLRCPKGHKETVLGSPVVYAVTCLVSCGPSEEKLSKLSIAACWPKLTELLCLCQPKIIVAMGKEVFGAVVANLHLSTPTLGYRPNLLSVVDPFWTTTQSDPVQHQTNARLLIEAAVEKYL